MRRLAHVPRVGDWVRENVGMVVVAIADYEGDALLGVTCRDANEDQHRGKREGGWCFLDSVRDGIYDVTSGSVDAHLYEEFIAGGAGRPLEVASLSFLSADA